MVTVRVTGTVVVDEFRVTVAGLKLQLLSGGKFEHIDGESVAEPVNPPCPLNVSIVEPDCPGVDTVIVDGFAVSVKAEFTATVSVTAADEPK